MIRCLHFCWAFNETQAGPLVGFDWILYSGFDLGLVFYICAGSSHQLEIWATVGSTQHSTQPAGVAPLIPPGCDLPWFNLTKPYCISCQKLKKKNSFSAWLWFLNPDPLNHHNNPSMCPTFKFQLLKITVKSCIVLGRISLVIGSIYMFRIDN